VKEAPKPVTPKSIRVGGNVQAAKLVRQPKPSYPPLAKQARIQGTVRFNAVIGRDGTIQNLTLASGHPLLVPSATDAVRQWVYQPTLLNGEPVEVVTQIDVNFTLSQ
jgi:protein TonB